jgi:hypothetical protein
MSWLKIKICGCRSARLDRPTLATNGSEIKEVMKFVYNGQIIWARNKKNFERKVRNLNKNK